MKRITIFTILGVLVLSLFPFESSQALTVGPPKFEFKADPGDVLTGEIRLRNEMDQTMTFRSSFESFTMKGGGVEPQFSGKREGLAAWLETNPSRVTLGPGEGKSVSFTAKVPENADPGGHYAAIFWSTAPPEGGGTGIGIVARMAILVLLDVSGEATESAEIDFRADKSFFSHRPVNFSFNFKNTGTVHLKPAGEIVIKNIFGKTAAIVPLGEEEHNILPNSQRQFSASWQATSEIEEKGFLAEFKKEKAGFALGHYKAVLNLEFGEKGTAQASVGFWIIPWRILLLGILALALLILGITKGLKLYNRWIITKARG